MEEVHWVYVHVEISLYRAPPECLKGLKKLGIKFEKSS